MTFYGKPYSETWEMAAKAAARHGVSLPNHFSNGLVFKLDKNSRLVSHAPFKVEEFEQELDGMEYTHSRADNYYDDAPESADVGGAISGMTKVIGIALAMKDSSDVDDDDIGMDDSDEDISDGGDDIDSTDDFGGDIFDGADDIFDTGDSLSDTFDGEHGDYGDHGHFDAGHTDG